MDFVAIDFETANRQPDSACQLAAVVVSQSRIVGEYSWLIRPPTSYFSQFNISIHGIRPSDVRDSPGMDLVWTELSNLLDGQVVMAHNARFDMQVLVASLAAHDIACPSIQFQCTRALARAAWPGRPAYGLKPLGNWLGISFKHHDALEDARCCANIALAVQAHLGQDGSFETSLDELERILNITRGAYRSCRLISPRMKRGAGRRPAVGNDRSGEDRRSTQLDPSFDRWGFPVRDGRRTVGGVCAETVLQASAGKPLSGKRIVMLGPLRGLSMKETQDLLHQLGGVVQPQIQADTDYVVVPGVIASQALTQLPEQVRSRATAAAAAAGGDLSRAGKSGSVGIRVLSERQFRGLLPGGAVSG
jgi:DNA polymerase III subunit epsilon